MGWFDLIFRNGGSWFRWIGWFDFGFRNGRSWFRWMGWFDLGFRNEGSKIHHNHNVPDQAAHPFYSPTRNKPANVSPSSVAMSKKEQLEKCSNPGILLSGLSEQAGIGSRNFRHLGLLFDFYESLQRAALLRGANEELLGNRLWGAAQSPFDGIKTCRALDKVIRSIACCAPAFRNRELVSRSVPVTFGGNQASLRRSYLPWCSQDKTRKNASKVRTGKRQKQMF
ncbi:hypothetical protein AVEN_44849-1 [Araneus ventricosus]|uniref:Uncharacterized protein n=1 Tax=Araneus ventricosus TaxID=182803 RepID=A0A4Y2CLA7_ARAVE|nr:hypothetical protein AVEN_44849-1 [Araneus ventricosus]